MERKSETGGGKGKEQSESHQPPHISPMHPVTHNAYGGGFETQSADGPNEAKNEPKHKPPPSSGDRDIDITGQSYIQ
ncbi:hypothetical protein ES332_A01G125900v1 [Gossypium tomentosum]|uniref:Uncharacterized protein n=1 Tax=Gossypium tomentosum TaxID=34277 RepID=A0A5D2RSF3_GOSTO|nr:hypothetical protein ES332_A01G125900v1 [Gossypium tomentosum]